MDHLDQETGPEGYPLVQELDPDNDGWFEARPFVNYASAARERYIDRHKNMEPGTRIAVVYTRPQSDDDSPSA